jgi:hypothetical protein
MLHQDLANRHLQPLGHSSVAADMPEEGASRKQQIPDRPIPTLFDFVGAPDFGFQVRFACLLCNSFWKTCLRNLAGGRLCIARAGSFGNFLVATEGGT